MTIKTIIEEFDKQLTVEGKGKHWSLSSGDIKNVKSFLQSQLSTFLDEIEKDVKTSTLEVPFGEYVDKVKKSNMDDMFDWGVEKSREKHLSSLNKYRV